MTYPHYSRVYKVDLSYIIFSTQEIRPEPLLLYRKRKRAKLRDLL
jgi:hypothetical protein